MAMQALKTLTGVLRSRYLEHRVPVAMTMALTYRCNLRCRYCQIWKSAGPEMTTRQVETALEELTEAGMCRLGFTGGEPLLREDIDPLVRHAKDLGLFTTLFTNGALIDGHMDTLRRLDVVLVSLDGPEAHHDHMRGRGAHKAALRAIERLRGEGITVWTNTVVTKDNLDAVDYVLDLAGRFGTHAALQPIFEHSYSVDAAHVQALRADRVQYDALIDTLIARKRSGAPLLNSLHYLEYVRNPSWRQNPRTCLAAQVYGAVSPDGKVAPCPVLLQMEGLPDGLRLGFAEAFRRSRKPVSCHGCFCIATVESDLLFGLDVGAMANTLTYLIKEQASRLRRTLTPSGQGPPMHAALRDEPHCAPEGCQACGPCEAPEAPGLSDNRGP